MVDYVTKHGQHEYIELWSNGARFTPGLGVGRFQKTRGQQRVKSRVGSKQAKRVELGVIVCAEYSYDRIRP
jgi:hypothetical protein